MIGNSPEVSNFNHLTYFSYSTGSSVTNRRFFHNPTVAQLNTICSKNDHYTIITIIVYYYLELRSAVTI